MFRIMLAASLSAALIVQPAAAPARQSASPIVSSQFTFETAPYPQVHASTIVQTAKGTIAAAWFGGTRERNPDVTIWFARHGPNGWDKAIEVATGVIPGGERQPTWNPVLFQPPGGDLHLFYKVGPSPKKWWGMVITSADDGRTWSRPRRLPEGILGPIKNKPIVTAGSAWLSPSSTEAEGKPRDVWQLHVERSTDGGKTWRASAPVASPVGIDAIQPSILVHRDGRLQMVARARQGAMASSWSKDGGLTWSPIAAIDLPNPNSGTDAVTLKDGRQLIVYNHSAHRADEPGKGDRWPLNVALSDDGLTWRNVLTLEREPIGSGYAYPAVIQAADGKVHVTYTWGRKRIRHIVIDPARLR